MQDNEIGKEDIHEEMQEDVHEETQENAHEPETEPQPLGMRHILVIGRT